MVKYLYLSTEVRIEIIDDEFQSVLCSDFICHALSTNNRM